MSGKVAPLIHFLVVVAAMGSPRSASAISGRVVWQDSGQPIARAEVAVLGRTQIAHTDRDGRFTLTPSPRPPFEVLVVLSGGTYMKPVRIDAVGSDGTIQVAVTPLLSESMTVIAGSTPSIESTPAAGTTLVPTADIQLRQPTNLSQALESVPGVANVSEGQAGVPAIRGLAGGRSLILIDDARVTSERRAGPSATYLDPFILEGVEVSRGPGSVAYGSDAFGGVILARTRGPEPGEPLRARLTMGAGVGVPQTRVGFEIASGLGDDAGVLLSVHRRDIADYDSPGGEVFNSGGRDQGFLIRHNRVVGSGSLSLGWQSDFGRDVERPRDNSRETRFYYPREDSHRLTASWQLGSVLGLNNLELSGFLGGYRLVTDRDEFASDEGPRAIDRADVKAKDFALRATAEALWGETRVEFGVDLNGRFGLEAEDVAIRFDDGRAGASDVDVTIEGARRTDSALFVGVERALSPLVTLSGGLRGDYVATRNRGGFFGDRSVANSAVSGFAAVTIGSLSGVSMTGQVARGFRDARLSDRFFRGVTGRGFITGNPELEPETSRQFDAALHYTAGSWRLALYGYEYRFFDLIERFEQDDDIFLFRNRSDARIRGLELEAQADLGAGVSLELALASSSGKSLADDMPLDDIAPPTASVQVRRKIGERGFVQLRASLYDEDAEFGPTEVAIPGYGLLDVAAGFELRDGIELRFLGRNLLDEDYPASTDLRAPSASGISGMVTLVLSF